MDQSGSDNAIIDVVEVEAEVAGAVNDVVEENLGGAIEEIAGEQIGDAVGDLAGDAAAEMATVALREVKGRLGALNISPSNFMHLVKYVMEVVEGKPIKGAAQKRLALRILTLFVHESDFGGADKAMCMTMITSGAVGNTIDLIVDATHGRINVNAATAAAAGCFSAWLARCLGRRRI